MHFIQRQLHKAGEMLTPVLSESAFAERGVLTPEEFVLAGDGLVEKCPTWQWCAGNSKKRRPYLPANKQFLVTRGVPCEKRVAALMAETEANAERELDGEDEGWLATADVAARGEGAGGAKEEYADISGEMVGDVAEEGYGDNAVVGNSGEGGGDDEDDDYLDLDDFIEENLATQVDNSTLQSSAGASAPGSGNAVFRVRTYDVSITYDKYYQTPRVWLRGYSERGLPLTDKQIFEDIMQDYRNKTVTIDPHPHMPHSLEASIHPCRHAETMKRIIVLLAGRGKEMDAQNYLFVFLKFVQSIIPLINYDFTFGVEA